MNATDNVISMAINTFFIGNFSFQFNELNIMVPELHAHIIIMLEKEAMFKRRH